MSYDLSSIMVQGIIVKYFICKNPITITQISTIGIYVDNQEAYLKF